MVYSSPGSQLRILLSPQISKKFCIISGHAYWDEEKLSDEKKTADEKNCEVPLRLKEGSDDVLAVVLN